ncbi:MAG: 1-deoxy-D-xylulose-5-phosphate synthase [Lentihominibacter sp.]|jgi:1-deoxy-D-xylulose-5-phosphate synthase
MSSYLSQKNFPDDLKDMSYSEMELLSYELRDFLVDTVAKTGGHLAPNLGVVELTMALHKCFDTPEDKIIWDVGHQAYIHKILTGRMKDFATLRKLDGLSGFPKVAESEYDLFDTGHSSTSISLGLGMALARDLKDEDYHVVSVIGDGAMTGGPAFEALNNAGNMDTNFIVILNDNGMSISPNTGGLSASLGRITSTDKYVHMKTHVKKGFAKVPVIGESIISGIHHAKENIKYAVIDGILFEELGFKYIGPVDGHNIKDLCETLDLAKGFSGPVLIHAVTKKGKGYSKAESNPDMFHGICRFDVATGKPIPASSGKTFSSVFGSKMFDMAGSDKNIVAVSAAMVDGVGLDKFAAEYPERMFDVGIAEGHAVTFSAGLAKAGLKPFVAIYSTFLQRAYDQIVEDICLQNLPVVLCIDRAGIVGSDGETHHGMFDMAFLKNLPNITVMAPGDGRQLEQMLEMAALMTTPCAVRYPRGETGIPIVDSPLKAGKAHQIKDGSKVQICAFGAMVSKALAAADLLEREGISAGVADMRFIKPIDEDLIIKSTEQYDLIVTVEDGIISGGAGESISAFLSESNTPVINLGWPDKFIEHGTQEELYARYGLDAGSIAGAIIKAIK